jgi:lactoylglutathione lyase
MKGAKVRFSEIRIPIPYLHIQIDCMNRLLKFSCFIMIICSSLHSRAQSRPHFDHTTIYVTDLARGADFYSRVMMLDTIPEPFHDHHHVWFRMGEHSQLHVVSGAKEDISHDVNIHLAFSVSSLPDFMKHLDQLGIKYGNFQGEAKKIAVRPDQIQQVYLQDPDGYWIEVNNSVF